ncbi:hypothetical protein K474DRAFT_1774564 [Panus rudis PR-1116 ss-1]|nr:hypothetical protein K474DRAFT_1774564 [Panus rudis PR-1116 ss-1]
MDILDPNARGLRSSADPDHLWGLAAHPPFAAQPDEIDDDTPSGLFDDVLEEISLLSCPPSPGLSFLSNGPITAQGYDSNLDLSQSLLNFENVDLGGIARATHALENGNSFMPSAVGEPGPSTAAFTSRKRRLSGSRSRQSSPEKRSRPANRRDRSDLR